MCFWWDGREPKLNSQLPFLALEEVRLTSHLVAVDKEVEAQITNSACFILQEKQRVCFFTYSSRMTESVKKDNSGRGVLPYCNDVGKRFEKFAKVDPRARALLYLTWAGARSTLYSTTDGLVFDGRLDRFLISVTKKPQALVTTAVEVVMFTPTATSRLHHPLTAASSTPPANLNPLVAGGTRQPVDCVCVFILCIVFCDDRNKVVWGSDYTLSRDLNQLFSLFFSLLIRVRVVMDSCVLRGLGLGLGVASLCLDRPSSSAAWHRTNTSCEPCA
ncbi:unnamed protein product, partial [Timema podura]|nr:unnamed protein product [Timema podura]